MPELFQYRIKIMRIHQIIQLISLIIAMFSCGLLLQCMFEGRILPSAAIILGIMALCSISSLIWSHKYIKRVSGQFPCYHIPVDVDSIDMVVERFSGNEVIPDSYVSFSGFQNIKIRTLITYCPSFSETATKKQRKKANNKVNSLFPTPSSEPYHKAIARQRINLVVCNSCNDELLMWINRMPEHLMHRNESILSAAIVLDEKTLLLPAIFSGGLDLKQINKYEYSCNMLFNSLSG